jgi:16S rRNA processing protein RimM
VGDAVVIGVVVRAHGLHGLVRARATGPTLELLRPGERVCVTDRDGRARELELVSQSPAGIELIIEFAEISTRDQADALRGGTIAVDGSRLPHGHDPDEFYVRDLVGCAVWIGESRIGLVREVINRPANDVVEVVGESGELLLLPFTRDAVRGVDLSGRRIDMRADLIDPSAAAHAPEDGEPHAD